MSKVELKNIIQKIEGTKAKLNRHFFSTFAMWLIVLGMIGSVLFNVYSLNNTLVEVKKELKELEDNQQLIILQTEQNEKEIVKTTSTIKKVQTNINNVDKWIVKYSRMYNVDPKLVESILIVESGKNVNAKTNGGAVGISQIKPSTAKGMGIDNVYNPENNIHASVKYLSYLKKKFNGDEVKVIAGYNAGPNRVEKQGIGVAKNYVNKVQKVKQNLK